jgi:hypothetical protein
MEGNFAEESNRILNMDRQQMPMSYPATGRKDLKISINDIV